MSITWTNWTQGAAFKFDKLMRTVFKASEAFGRKVRTQEWEDAVADITWQSKCRDYNRQRACRHLKGGKHRGGLQQKDYAVTAHTFISGKTRIKCMLCGLEAWNQSGQDYKYAYMLGMAEYSTNALSASEQPLLGVVFNDRVVEVFNNVIGVEKKIKAKYPLWDGTVKPIRQGVVSKETKTVYRESVYNTPEEKFVNIGEDTNPIKGIQPATKLDIPDQTKVIQTGAGEVFYKAQDGTAVSLGIMPPQPDLKGDLQ